MRKRLAAVGIGALVIVALTAAPASASSNIHHYYDGVYVAYGEFQSYGDHWTVCDMRADGRGAYLHWRVPSTGRIGALSDTNGSNNSCMTQNVNIGEGRGVEYVVCLTDAGNVLWWTCSNTRYDTA